MNRFLIVAGVIVAGLVFLVGLGGVAKFVRDRNQRATDEQIRAEREADRAEARAAFADPTPPSPAEAEEFGRFLRSLGTALERGDETAVATHFDADRLTGELIRLGTFERMGVRPSDRNRTDMARGVREGLGRALIQNELLRWETTRVRCVRWAAGRREAVVIATHRSEVGGEVVETKIRWWLVAGGGAGWKAYDLEDLDLGSRATQMMASIMSPDLLAAGPAEAARIHSAVAAVREAMAAVLRQDLDSADRTLAAARGKALPAPAAALRGLTEAALAVARRDHAAALAFLDEADRLLPGMPCSKILRATALNLAGRYEEALGQARGYVAELGPDAVAFNQTGYALEGLTRAEEAAIEYRRALDESPDQLDALFGLRRVLPDDKKGEIGERLAKARDPLKVFDDLLRDARDDGDAAGAAALLAGLRKVNPDDPRVAEEEVRGLVRDGKFPEAAAMVRRRVGDAPPGPDRPPPVLTAYLFAMLNADRAVEALAGVPRAHAAGSFRTLAEELEDRRFDEEPKAPPPDPDPLSTLIAARRKQAPGDPWTWYYDAGRLQAADRHEEAAKVLADGAAALAKWDGPLADHDRDRFRSRRVDSLYRSKKGLAALAEVGPADKTFRELARLYAGDKDADGLAALADAHAAKHPADRAVMYFKAEVHFLKADYPQAARLFADYRRTAGEKDDPNPATAADREVRARVRAGDVAGARAVVAGLPTDRLPVSLRAVVAAAAGDVAGLGQLLEEQAKTPGRATFLYYDDDFTRLFAAPVFESLRKQYPDPRPPRPAGPAG